MMKRLTHCPYCNDSIISLNESFEVVFNADMPYRAPCDHLIVANGGCSQWEHRPHGTSRVIGSTVICWKHPALQTNEPACPLLAYLERLAQAGKGWEFAPAEAFEVQVINEDGSILGPLVQQDTGWEADGWAIYAREPAAFLTAIATRQEKESATWHDMADPQATVSMPGGLG